MSVVTCFRCGVAGHITSHCDFVAPQTTVVRCLSARSLSRAKERNQVRPQSLRSPARGSTRASAPTQEKHTSTSTAAPIPSAGDRILSPPVLATSPIEEHFPSTPLKPHRLAHHLRTTLIKTLFSPSCTTFPSVVRLVSMVQGFRVSHLTSPPPSNTEIVEEGLHCECDRGHIRLAHTTNLHYPTFSARVWG